MKSAQQLFQTRKMISFSLFLIIVLLVGCASPQKALQRGDYDKAISISVQKLRKNPDKEKYIYPLGEAYRLANQFDKERIVFLKKSGEPHIWEEVFSIYNDLKRRQDKVRVLNRKVLSKINFIQIDYDKEIIASKRKAAEYYYAHGKSLLAQGSKSAARKAFTDFNLVKNFFSDYKDVDRLIDDAYYNGINYVLFQVKNKSNSVLPEGFERELKKVNLSQLESRWVKYESKKQKDVEYDYYVFLNLKSFQVSPDDLRTKDFIEEKEIEDGWQYVLDSQGNVMKDSLGVDVKVPKYTKVSAYITEIHMHKRADVTASLDYVDARNNRLIKSNQLGSQSIFDHLYADIKGDVRAMSVKTKKLSRTRPLPFPDDLDMIYRTTEDLKAKAKNILKNNKRLLEK